MRETRRGASARETRRLITEAATALFIERGYAATSMREIAAAAGVVDKTLYLSFGTKADLLRAVVDHAIAGDDEPVPIAERTWFRAILDTTDPRDVLKQWIDHQHRMLRRLADLTEMVRAAANSNPELAELYHQRRTALAVDVTHIARSLATRSQLRTGTTTAEAANQLNIITGPEIYRLLVIDQRWSNRRYRTWCQQVLEHALLPTGDGPD